jgi:RNA polymerase sigma-70 factor (ECF subfamily)
MAEKGHHLNRITTHWTLVFQAHQGPTEAVSAAQQALLQRYCGAIYRYALAALRDPAAAEEVLQEFAVCFVRGDFKQADPGRGRFRDLVKTVLFHLIINHQRQRQKQARLGPLPPDSQGVAAKDAAPGADADREFLTQWRDELLDRAWEALKDVQEQTGQCFYEVLRLRAEQPRLSSGGMAEQLGARLGRRLTAAGVRQILHRAREKFAELLLAEVARSLQTEARERLEQELIDLGLWTYCRTTMQQRPEG